MIPTNGSATRRWEPLERALTLTLMAFMAALTLEWVSFGGLGSGVLKPFHVLELLLIALCFARWRPARLLLPVLRRFPGVFGSYSAFLVLVAVAGLARNDPYVDRSDLVRLAFYFFTSAVIAGLFLHVAGRRSQRLLIWTGAVAGVVLVVGLFASLAAAHQNPVALVKEAIAKGDPDIVSHQLFRIAFRSHEEFAQAGANLRHKVFSALLVAFFLSLACAGGLSPKLAAIRRPSLALSQRTKVVLTIVSVCGFGLVMLSLSRWLTLCLAGTLMLLPLKMLIRKRARPAQVAAVGAASLLVLTFILSPLGGLVVSHIEDTKSYQGRASAASSGFLAEVQDSTLFGAHKSEVEKSAHNVVLDAWLAAGLLGCIAALVFVVSYGHVWVREARRYVTGGPGWVLPIGQLWLLGLGLVPLVRTVTAGNGLHMSEWAAVGIFLGLTHANHRQSVRDGNGHLPRSTRFSAPSPAPGPAQRHRLPLEDPQPRPDALPASSSVGRGR
jgi:hypothetical protein